jgi:serine/threonine protein phosphatase PrpC
MNAVCPFCGGPLQPRSRFCPTCGRPLPVAAPPSVVSAPPGPAASDLDPPLEAALSAHKRIHVNGDSLDLRKLINVVESAMHWWQDQLTGGSAATRMRAAEAIEDLSRILHSLAQQLAQGRETVRITRRLPTLRDFPFGCPACGHGNRASAKYCQVCGTALAGPVQEGQGVGTPMPLRIKIAARTDVGRVRQNNQDAVYTGKIKLSGGSNAYLCLVADGMGGAAAGEQASRIASEVTQTQVRSTVDSQRPPNDDAWQKLLHQVASMANRRVYEESRANIDHKGMGTTLTIALIVGDRLYIASVGDSRAYLINAGGVTEDGATSAQLTSDHSLVARLVDIGQITPEQARTHPQKNLLYRSIGTDPSVEVDTFAEQLEPGDILLLCSDGLINHVRDEEIAEIVLAQRDPNRACEQLVTLANQRGGRDNISVVIVRAERDK